MPVSPCSTRASPRLQAGGTPGLPSMMATDSRRSRAVSAATDQRRRVLVAPRVRCISVSRNQRSKSIRPVLATSRPSVVVDPVPGEGAGPDDLVGGPAVGVDGQGQVDQAAGATTGRTAGGGCAAAPARRVRPPADCTNRTQPSPISGWGRTSGKGMAAKVRSREPSRRVVLPMLAAAGVAVVDDAAVLDLDPGPQLVGEPEAVGGLERLQVLQHLRGRRVVVGDAEAERQLGLGAFHRPERDP